MTNTEWASLNSLQLSQFAEYLIKMEFASYGFEIYIPDVDCPNGNFLTKKGDGPYFKIQVKSVRGLKSIYFADKFNIKEDLFGALVLFISAWSPQLYLIPSTAWKITDGLFVTRSSIGENSISEWGLSLSSKNLDHLNSYLFDKIITDLSDGKKQN